MERRSMGMAWPALLWLALACCCSVHPTQAQVLGDVFIYTNNYTFDPFPDLPADFGPEVPDEGIDGLLRVADPEDACQPFTYTDTEQTWVALISRSQQLHPTNCTFDVKVRHAEEAGAAAAIVYDDVYEALIIMSKPRDHLEPGIPAVFVSEKAGIIMRKLLTPGQTRVRIVPVSASAWMSLIMSAFLGFLALTVVLATFYVMRSWSVWLGRTRGRRLPTELAGLGGYGGMAQPPVPAGLPACAIRALPVLVYEGKASKRRRHSAAPQCCMTPSAAQAARLAGGQPLSPTYASVGEAVWPTAVGGSNLQQASRLCATGGSDSAVAGNGSMQAAGRAAAALFFPADPHLLSSSAPAAVSSVPDSSREQQQQQQQQQAVSSMALFDISSTLSPTSSTSSLTSVVPVNSNAACLANTNSSSSLDNTQQPLRQPASAYVAQNSGVSAAGMGLQARAAADLMLLQRSRSETPVSSPGLSTDEDEPEMLAVSGVITGGPLGSRGGATRRTCVICLERYVEGDKVRVLPCQHRFHSRCIDPWLTNRRLCPVCKHDASQQPPPALQRELAAAAARAAAAAGAAAAGEAPAGARDGSAGAADATGMRGFGFLRRLRARFRQVQPQPPAAGAAPSQAAGAAAQPQLQPAAAYAAAAAAADAAEAGLLPGSLRPAAGQQHRWRSRQRSGQRQFRRAALAQQQEPQQYGQAGDLMVPLLLGSGGGGSIGGSSRGSSRNGVQTMPARLQAAHDQSLPLLIPQLTPVQSDASSAGSSFTFGHA